jgi:HK97 family phage prohead protease
MPTIYARDDSPRAVHDAFRRAAPRRWGPGGPIDQSVIYVPGGPTEAQVRASRTVAPRVKPLAALDRIRSHPHAIGGYACQFNQASWRGPHGDLVKPGAFAHALAAGGWFLLRDHLSYAEGASSLASMAAGSLVVSEDSTGLWFESHLPDTSEGERLFDQVRRGEITSVSIGSKRSEGVCQVNGLHVWSIIDGWEISIVVPPNQPARVYTWVRPLGVAMRERQKLRAA